jgi:sugar phosphate isomerase/epimerase
LAERHTLKTIEFAARVKAPMVVLHLGCIEMKEYTEKLLRMAGRGEKSTPKYAKLCVELSEKREAKKTPFIERLTAVLKKILPVAERRGVKLGIENRQGLEELPLESDFQILFHELDSPNAVYWHDTGHAQIKDNLGFIHHALHLESLRDRTAGFHIHDVRFPGEDHCAPGSGTVDFAALKPFVKPGHIKVFEFSPAMPVGELKHGVEHVKQIWGGE